MIHYLNFSFAILVGVFFWILPFISIGRRQPHWLRTAFYLAGVFTFFWGLFGFIPLILREAPSTRITDLFYHIRAFFGGGAGSLIVFLFISKGVFKLGKSAEQGAAANP